MKGFGAIVVTGILLASQAGSGMPNGGKVTHFVHGLWFDGTRFVAADWYVEGQTFTRHPKERRSYATVDLHGAFVVPPFGDAHEHNFDSPQTTAKVVAAYLHDGIFYAQGMTDNPEGAAAVVTAGLVDMPSTPDVTYAHGGLTGVNGHPKEVYESLANGFYYPQDDAQRALVINGHKREGKAYWEIPDEAALAAKWPEILAQKPDLIKVYLASADHFKQATADDPQLGKGIDPSLVKPIVQRAHQAGLRVFAHVDTAYDYHVALVAGVDGMAHLPGYGISAKDDLSEYRIPDEDIARTARQHVVVIATASISLGYGSDEDQAARRKLSQNNLGRLKKAGVLVLLGSDRYGSDSVQEADYLQSLGVWSNAETLRMWAVTTPQSILPKRKIGRFKTGYEASFVVLDGDPTKDWSAVHRITQRWKQGQMLAATDH